MKLQSLSIIFIIIIFPMILVFTYYLGLQIDTISLQNDYKNSLIDATSDAMSAFEINTANEELSNASDSLRTIVDASTNTFINTLSTSLGMSNANKENIQPYIPAILYTMYDGYYIYSPTQTPVILEKTTTDANEITTSEGAATVGEKGIKYRGKIGENTIYEYDETAPETSITEENKNDVGALLYKRNDGKYSPIIDENTVMKTDYILKSYMPYSATYMEDGVTDLNGNGTVDDRVTIEYTLDNFIIVSGIIDGVYYTKSGYYINDDLVTYCDISNWNLKGQDELKEICLDESKTIKMKIGSIEIQSNSEANRKAITYYLTNTVFTKWVNMNLKDIVTGNNLQTVINFDNPDEIGYTLDNMNAIYHNFKNEGEIFDEDLDPESEDSVFNNHKYNIIKNSIQYNLNLGMSSYNEMFTGLNFEMPQLSDDEWEQITEKLSIVSFMQGIDCGLKNYNGYAVISSTNNEMTVIPEEIYYVKEEEFNNENSYYHRLDCSKLDSSSNLISFVSKEVKYDEIYLGDSAGTYEYDHKNLACYDCIVQNNYNNYASDDDGEKDKRIKLRAFLNFEYDTEIGTNNKYRNEEVNADLQKAYYIAVAKERQNLYKTTEHSKNEGMRIFASELEITSDFDKIDRFEITLQVTNLDYEKVVDNVRINSDDDNMKAISTTTSSIQTVEIKNNNYTDSISISCQNGTAIHIESIKAIYK